MGGINAAQYSFFIGASKAPTAEADPMFQTSRFGARSSRENMGFKDPGLVLKLALRQQRALALRGSGDYRRCSRYLLIELLKEKSAVNLQIDAAETLHDVGQSEVEQRCLRQSHDGHRPF